MIAKTYKRTLVNPDLISLAHTPHVRVEITAESYRMKAEKLSKNEDGAITVFPVVNLDTGEVALLMGNTVLEKTLAAQPNGYVGKKWEILSGDIKEGTEYRPVKVLLLED